MQEILLRVRYSERGLLKTCKKVNSLISFEPIFNGQSYQKQ